MTTPNVELDSEAPVFSFQIRKDGVICPVVITAADYQRFSNGEFVPEDAEKIGVLTQFSLNQEVSVAQQTAFYIAMMSFLHTLVEQGKVEVVAHILKAHASSQIDRLGEMLAARLGENWLEQAAQVVTAVTKDILSPSTEN